MSCFNKFTKISFKHLALSTAVVTGLALPNAALAKTIVVENPTAQKTTLTLSGKISADPYGKIVYDKSGKKVLSTSPNAVQGDDFTACRVLAQYGQYSASDDCIYGKINKPLTLAPGAYYVNFGGVGRYTEISNGEEKVVSLIKVVAPRVAGAISVAMTYDGTGDSSGCPECNGDGVGTWYAENTRQTCKQIRVNDFNIFDGFQAYDSEKCQSKKVKNDWSGAYFLVQEGTYSLEWSFSDDRPSIKKYHIKAE